VDHQLTVVTYILADFQNCLTVSCYT